MGKNLFLAACLLVAGCAADPGHQFVPAYGAPLKGPAAANGAVIWSHGMCSYCGVEQSKSPMPAFAALFRDAGWDVYRLNRPNQSEEPRTGAAALAERATALKKEGYARVVLAGQSGGGWISLMAAGQSPDIDAAIAVAPAWYGTSAGSMSPYFAMNSSVLLDHLAEIRRVHVVIGFFQNDPYDPPGRAAAAERILAGNGVPHLVIDHPDGLSGHGAGHSGAFAQRYGKCLLAFAADEPVLPAGCGTRSSAAY